MKKPCIFFLIFTSLQVLAENDLQLIGKSRLQVLFWPIYECRLLNTSGTWAPYARPLRFEITYLRDFKAQTLIKRTAEEWKKQGIEHPNQLARLDRLSVLWPDIRANDELAIELDSANRSVFYHNGKKLGEIDDQAFGELFLAIWLSPQTSQPEQRLALIGNRASSKH